MLNVLSGLFAEAWRVHSFSFEEGSFAEQAARCERVKTGKKRKKNEKTAGLSLFLRAAC